MSLSVVCVTNTASALKLFVNIFLVHLPPELTQLKFWERIWALIQLDSLKIKTCEVKSASKEKIELNVLLYWKINAGRLAKKECAAEFSRRGCSLCLDVLESEEALTNHRLKCQFMSACPSGKVYSLLLRFVPSFMHVPCSMRCYSTCVNLY